ncbi:hypothetical protein A3A71_03715 [Candidatus Berkelbacteria bacterium RIFCSPLOWO2_01_FULL_50_28]|uniref:Uncharacterized protein n=1 Tax=Candidatus Berkelbacteria bacterium RIFCSPLOWO2_01_FULL_50_28 TaxID=1797471 RepID=A0A1F5EA15_9BACT|nr:MAG: hypothetical protein A3F39_01080 [Candidatus Berkelbacteria bacterium RIFCSPHIGHO2_12_FULL_50_11]OGD64257.1 MAG: hypothetical protein A3A71_03715 [Candidatus Berkelbacteria bacterium RIFCSPLOWO2_01_FULL_50_28]
MKRKNLLFGGVLVLLLAVGYILYSPNQASEQNTSVSSAEETFTELDFSAEQLKDYYIVYENPFVIAIRTSLNNYLDGNIDTGFGDTTTAIDSSTGDDGTVYGLDSFDKEYYQSKFIVFARNEYNWGGELINIVFVDKPDKLFTAWMYKGASGYEMRGFSQNTTFGAPEMKKFNQQYAKFFRDTEHSL